MQQKPTKRVWLMLTVTSKGAFPYAEGREFDWQLDMEDQQ